MGRGAGSGRTIWWVRGSGGTPSAAPAAPPAAPSDFAAAMGTPSGGHLLLTWTDNSDNETGFEIEYDRDSGGWVSLTTTAADATSYDHDQTGFEGLVILYRIRAVNGAGQSAWVQAGPYLIT